jgi:hypothetical protein
MASKITASGMTSGLPARRSNMLADQIGKTASRAERGVQQNYRGIVALRIEERKAAVSAGRTIVPVTFARGIVQPTKSNFHAAQCVGSKFVR